MFNAKSPWNKLIKKNDVKLRMPHLTEYTEQVTGKAKTNNGNRNKLINSFASGHNVGPTN